MLVKFSNIKFKPGCFIQPIIQINELAKISHTKYFRMNRRLYYRVKSKE
jgi:hypothetical protein